MPPRSRGRSDSAPWERYRPRCQAPIVLKTTVVAEQTRGADVLHERQVPEAEAMRTGRHEPCLYVVPTPPRSALQKGISEAVRVERYCEGARSPASPARSVRPMQRSCHEFQLASGAALH